MTHLTLAILVIQDRLLDVPHFSYIHVEQQDVDNLYAIADRGIKLEIRAVPSDKSIDAIELLDKKFK